MRHALGERPETEGLYAVEIHFGWKLLEWHADAWWHTDLIGRWTASIPVQWVGPLPPRRAQEPEKPKMEFDL